MLKQILFFNVIIITIMSIIELKFLKTFWKYYLPKHNIFNICSLTYHITLPGRVRIAYTDYNYALLIGCQQVSDDGSCVSGQNMAVVYSRTKDIPQISRQIIVETASKCCLSETDLRITTQHGNVTKSHCSRLSALINCLYVTLIICYAHCVHGFFTHI